MNSRVFKLCRVYSSSLKLSAVGEFPRSRLLGTALKFRKRKRKRMKILPCSTNQVLFWRPRCRCCRRCYSSLPAVNDSPTQDYAHRDDHILSPYVIFFAQAQLQLASCAPENCCLGDKCPVCSSEKNYFALTKIFPKFPYVTRKRFSAAMCRRDVWQRPVA